MSVTERQGIKNHGGYTRECPSQKDSEVYYSMREGQQFDGKDRDRERVRTRHTVRRKGTRLDYILTIIGQHFMSTIRQITLLRIVASQQENERSK